MTDPADTDPLAAPLLSPLCRLSVRVGSAVEVGATPLGFKRVVPILGGEVLSENTVNTHQFEGVVMAGGADFQTVLAAGDDEFGLTTALLDARYVIHLSDGAKVFVHNTALRHASASVTASLMRGEPVSPSSVYFRCQPRFETAAPQWQWLHQFQFIGTGWRAPDCVHMRFFAVR